MATCFPFFEKIYIYCAKRRCKNLTEVALKHAFFERREGDEMRRQRPPVAGVDDGGDVVVVAVVDVVVARRGAASETDEISLSESKSKISMTTMMTTRLTMVPTCAKGRQYR